MVEHEERSRTATKLNHDSRHRARSLPPLRQSDLVVLRDTGMPAVVQSHPAPRSYVVKTAKGRMIRRNRAALVGAEVPGSHTANLANQPERRRNATQGGAEVPGLHTANPANQPECAVGSGGAEVPGSHTANPASPESTPGHGTWMTTSRSSRADSSDLRRGMLCDNH